MLEVFGPAHIGDHTHGATVIGQALAQDHGAAVFKHCGLYRTVDQQALAGLPACAIGGDYAAAVQVQPLAAGQAHMATTDVDQPRHQACQPSRVLGAGDANDRNAAIRLRVKQVLHNGAAYGATFAVGGLDMCQQAGAGVDLNDGTALALHGFADVFHHHVDARNIQTHYACGQGSGCSHTGVHLVSHVPGHVAVALDQHFLAFFWHRVRCQAGAAQLQLHFGAFVWLDGAEWGLFFLAAARVGVDLGIDQFSHSGCAIAHDPSGFAAGGSHHLFAHHQQAVLVAGDKFLDDDTATALLLGHMKSGFHTGLV